MSRDKKLLIYAIIVSMLAITFVILNYEHEINKIQRLSEESGVQIKTEYTAQEIRDLIAGEEGYLGDSVTVYEDGTIKSSNPQFQGTIDNITQNPPDIDVIESLIEQNRLPRPVMVYRLAAHYYLTEYPEERKKQNEKKTESIDSRKGQPADSAQSKSKNTTPSITQLLVAHHFM